MNEFYTSLQDAYYFGAAALNMFDYWVSEPSTIYWLDGTAPPDSWKANRTVCCDITKCLENTHLPPSVANPSFEVLQKGDRVIGFSCTKLF